MIEVPDVLRGGDRPRPGGFENGEPIWRDDDYPELAGGWDEWVGVMMMMEGGSAISGVKDPLAQSGEQADALIAYTGSEMLSIPMTLVEMPTFLRDASAVWAAEERFEMIAFLACNPEAGEIMADTGGARKLRWGVAGRGKRSGARVIYYFTANCCLCSC